MLISSAGHAYRKFLIIAVSSTLIIFSLGAAASFLLTQKILAGTCSIPTNQASPNTSALCLETPELIAPVNDSVLNGGTITSSWTSVDGATAYEYEVCIGENGQPGEQCQQTVSSETYQTLTSLNDDAVYWWRVRATNDNLVKTHSDWTGYWKFTVDNISPSATMEPVNGARGGKKSSVKILAHINDKHIKSYEFSVQGTTIGSGEKLTSKNGQIDFNWDVKALPSGIYKIELKTTDKAKNSTTITMPITVDNTAPVISIIPIKGKVIGKSISPSVYVDGETGINKTYNYFWTAGRIDGVDTNPDILDFDAFSMEPIFSPSIAGFYTFAMTVTDELGNSDSQEFSFDWSPASTSGRGGNDTNNLAYTDANQLQSTGTTTPSGLVKTPFNTNVPQSLGAETQEPNAYSAPKETTKKADSVRPKEKMPVNSTETSYGWLFILLLMAIIASYYGYRNWKLDQQEK